MIKSTHNIKHKKVAGFISSYMLYGIALMAILGTAYGKIYQAKSQAVVVQEAIESVESQIITISSRISECTAQEPTGDHGVHGYYPHYPAPSPSGAIAQFSTMNCPNGSVPRPISAFGYIPMAPPQFNPWMYENSDTNGVQLILSAKVPGGAVTELRRLRNRLSQSFDVSNASTDDVLIIRLESI
ncbi:MAG: hypothetical protein QE278_06495 [Limnobacter sp.]|nr:hypothetical protein [Limnobacter sp.]